MRMVLSILLTFCGLVSMYLFASGAVSGLSWEIASFEAAVARALDPFLGADFVSTLVLSVGVAFFAAGVLLTPRSDVWIAFAGKETEDVVERRVRQRSTEISKEKVLEIALAFNVLIVLALVTLLVVSAFQTGPTRVVGALWIAAALETLIGVGIVVILFVRGRKSADGRFRPLFAAAAGMNVLETIFVVGVFAFGSFGA